MKNIARCAVSIIFLLAGIFHLRSPDFFVMIVPPGFGNAHFDVLISGIFEICGGVGLQIPALRRLSGFGLVALLIAVWPANWYMALHADQFHRIASQAVLWGRVPLQLLFILLVLWVANCV